MSNDQQGTPLPDDQTQPVRPDGLAPPPATHEAADPAPAPAARRSFGERFRTLRRSSPGDRTFGLGALIASALAGVIVGGLGLSAVHAVTHDGPGDRGDRGAWMQGRDGSGERGPDFDGRGGVHGGPPGMPGQVQPTTPPEDDSDG